MSIDAMETNTKMEMEPDEPRGERPCASGPDGRGGADCSTYSCFSYANLG